MPADRRRRRVGALVSAVGLVVILCSTAGLTGATSTRPDQVTLAQVPPPPAVTAGPDAAVAGAVDAAAGNDAAGVASGDGVATAAEAPPATTATTVAGARAAARPRSNVAPTTTTAPTGTVEQRGAAALALINYPWPRTGYSIVFAGPNPNLLGLTEPSRKQITIYIRPTQSTPDIARVLGHEIGHSVDFTMTSDAERADYRRIRGLDDRPWYPNCTGCSDYASPVGDWAETFAYWLLGDGSFASQLALKPTAAQLTALTPLFTADAVPLTPPATRPPTTTTTTTKAPRATTPKATTTTAPRATTPRPRPTTTTTRSTPMTSTTRSTPMTSTTRSSSTTTTTRSTPTTTTTANSGSGSTSPGRSPRSGRP